MRKESYLGLSALGFHRLVYREWGPEESERTLLCVHGLSRNGRDFEPLAEALAGEGWRVVAPDIVGRGDSDWACQPQTYDYVQYLADMNALIARLGVAKLDWLGTSMGGLIGMMLAAQPGTPIKRLILNDVGPFIPKASLERLSDYVGAPVDFPDLAAAEAYARETFASFGRLGDGEWRFMAEICFRRNDAGRYVPNYDPAIARVFDKKPLQDVVLWPVYDAISQPTLVLRGAESDLLLGETAAEMQARGPKAKVVVMPGCGHAPSLYEESQIAALRDWLRSSASG